MPRKSCFPFYDPKSFIPDLELGLLFDDDNQFKEAIVDYVVHTKKDVWFSKNEPKRVKAMCASTCFFQCTANYKEKLKCFQVKTLCNMHRCNSKYKLQLVSTKWLL